VPSEYGDPPLLAAARWLEAALFGDLATSVAIIAVAALGLFLLQGRLPLRRSATAILGCFLLFGSPLLALGLQSSAAAFGSRPDPIAGHPWPLSTPLAAQEPQELPGNERYASPTVMR
jgi:type IV secretory pathway VirB2 component (pilin)